MNFIYILFTFSAILYYFIWDWLLIKE